MAAIAAAGIKIRKNISRPPARFKLFTIYLSFGGGEDLLRQLIKSRVSAYPILKVTGPGETHKASISFMVSPSLNSDQNPLE